MAAHPRRFIVRYLETRRFGAGDSSAATGLIECSRIDLIEEDCRVIRA
jgi:hypothetical protein